ncbi:MAG: TonB family protein [Rhizomicrobium sp.]|jgi:TonB family protein
MPGGVRLPTVLNFLVGPDGRVSNVSIAQSSGDSGADFAFEADISGWQYSPAIKDGKPVAMRSTAKSACRIGP